MAVREPRGPPPTALTGDLQHQRLRDWLLFAAMVAAFVMGGYGLGTATRLFIAPVGGPARLSRVAMTPRRPADLTQPLPQGHLWRPRPSRPDVRPSIATIYGPVPSGAAPLPLRSAAAVDPALPESTGGRRWRWPLAGGLGALTVTALLRSGSTFTGLGFTGSLLASVAGAAVATIALHPVNTIKTRIQVGLPALDPVRGLPGLYSGLLFGLASDLPTESIAMAMSVLFKSLFVTWEGGSVMDHSHTALFMFSIWSGALGTVASSFVEAPMEMLMKQMQTKQSRSPWEVVRGVFCSEGCGTRLLNSWLVLLLREVPFGSFQFAIYEASLLALGHFFKLPLSVNALIGGALAGALTMVIVAPLDVLVSRIMTEDGEHEAPPKEAEMPRGGMAHVVALAKEIWQQEGLRGFWKGTVAGTLYYGLWACLFFAVYEVLAAIIM